MGFAARHIQIGQAHADEPLADGLLLGQWQISFEDVSHRSEAERA